MGSYHTLLVLSLFPIVLYHCDTTKGKCYYKLLKIFNNCMPAVFVELNLGLLWFRGNGILNKFRNVEVRYLTVVWNIINVKFSRQGFF